MRTDRAHRDAVGRARGGQIPQAQDDARPGQLDHAERQLVPELRGALQHRRHVEPRPGASRAHGVDVELALGDRELARDREQHAMQGPIVGQGRVGQRRQRHAGARFERRQQVEERSPAEAADGEVAADGPGLAAGARPRRGGGC